ncbi:MAG: archease [Deltaproteobacteria bacterium]|nr:archease [Deltaproteobacteria bacterium]MBI2363468.1 archease [Deltaproteobacteria bacterium]MBI3065062.1 archease [Deltaproteobacteria bacterium]
MENQKKYRVTTRQSELAVKVMGGSQADLFANSAFALFDVMVDPDKIEIKERLPLEVEGADRDDLLVNWMRELLYFYQGSGYLLKEFVIREVKDTSVKAEVCGEKIDPDRHEIKQEIAAVAYHQSRMTKTGNQWTAQLIFEV